MRKRPKYSHVWKASVTKHMSLTLNSQKNFILVCLLVYIVLSPICFSENKVCL